MNQDLPPGAPPHDVYSDTWTATDALGRRLPGFQECGPLKPNRSVGIFYFICHNHRSPHLPLNVTDIIAANPGKFTFQPNAGHYWGEPEPGYYLSTDRWVIRKHAYQLADAGVDTLIFDTTNNLTFPEATDAICEVFSQVRAEGERTPQICFLASEKSIYQAWEHIYAKGRFQDLWFRWKGRPLLIFGQWEKVGKMSEVKLPQEIEDFFTIRLSWAWDSLPWYGEDGYHRWPWVAHYPQPVGWDVPGVAEMLPVAVGQHPLSNIGRSFHDGQQPPVNEYDVTPFTDQGLHFQEQWRRAFEVDPEFIFLTGWNEWAAGSVLCKDPSQEALQALWDFFPGAKLGRAGRELKAGDVYFIDQYNREFSRDAEPMRGGHTDNYYYQMVANIRRYKGVRPPPPVSAPKTIDIQGGFEQWDEVEPEYRDHLFDTLPRDEPGASLQLHYRQDGGRNEFVSLKVARDDDSFYFLARTREPITPWTDPNWMMLFISTGQAPGWHGYDYLVNWPPLDAGVTTVKKSLGGWQWAEAGSAAYRVEGCQLMLAVPRALLGSPERFEFHWSDHLRQPGDIEDFLTSGDSAPNRRFNYLYDPTR